MKKRDIRKVLVMSLLFFLALALICYPYLANYVFEHRADSLVSSVEKKADELNDEEQNHELELARAYNEKLLNGHVQLTDPFIEDKNHDNVAEYESLCRLTEDGVMGSIEIPSISVNLPIYHGTNESVLTKGAGHLQGTSLPVGGQGTHSVITGHTGLSHAKLFTDLVELKKDDVFILHVMGENLAYQVDQIKVVLPDEMDDLAIMPDKDYCTLLTCTPYGKNTHRLLVRGVRTDYKVAVNNSKGMKPKAVESKWMKEYREALIVSLAVLTAGVITLIIFRKFRKDDSVIDEFQ